MSQGLKLILFILLGFWSSKSYSLSCSSMSTGYEAAQVKEAIVVRVKLIQKDDVTSAATLKVEKVYKGDRSVKLIKLAADELGYGNAATSRKVGDVWVEIFVENKDRQDFYYSMACAISSFKFDQNNKIKVYLSEASTTDMTEEQFVDYINGDLIPIFSGLQCYINFYDYENGFSFNKAFKIDLVNSYYFTLVEDLSVKNKKYKTLKALVYLSGNQLEMSMTDPFTQVSSATNYSLKPLSKEHYSVDYTLYTSAQSSDDDALENTAVNKDGTIEVTPLEPGGSDLSFRCSPQYQITL